MDKDVEKMEIRSEKVRRIMGDEPPWWISYGIYIIIMILIIMAIIANNLIKC